MTHDPMPVFTIKAKDYLALRTVDAYRAFCDELGLDEQAREVELAFAEMDEWRQRNPGEVKLPDHKHVPVRAAADHPDCLCPGEIPHPERGMQPGAAADHHARPAEAETTETRCAWCHRPGHTAEAHPFPKGHRQYDAFYDAPDDELAVMVSNAIAPGRAERQVKCEEPTCPDFGDPDFGEGTCPAEHARPAGETEG